MQINLSPTLSTSNAEAAASASPAGEPQSAGSFFAQIDQALKRDMQQENTADTKQSRPARAKAADSPPRLFPGAPLVASTAAKQAAGASGSECGLSASSMGFDETSAAELLSAETENVFSEAVSYLDTEKAAGEGDENSDGSDPALTAGMTNAIPETFSFTPTGFDLVSVRDYGSTDQCAPDDADNRSTEFSQSLGAAVQRSVDALAQTIGAAEQKSAVSTLTSSNNVPGLKTAIEQSNRESFSKNRELVAESDKATGSDSLDNMDTVSTPESSNNQFEKDLHDASTQIVEYRLRPSEPGANLKDNGSSDAGLQIPFVRDDAKESAHAVDVQAPRYGLTAENRIPSQGMPAFEVNGNGEAKNSETVAAPAKSELAAPEIALENAGAPDMQAGQQSEHDSSAFGIRRSGEGSFQPDAPKFRIPSADGATENSLQIGQAHARLIETGNNPGLKEAEPAATQPRDFVLQLADRMQVLLRDGKEEIRIQLHPESLGSLEIRAESTVNGVVARIVAESGNVKNFLETNMHLLQQSLQDQGLKIEKIQVSIQDNSGFQASSGHAGHTGSGHHARETGNVSRSALHREEDAPADSLPWSGMNPKGRFYTVA